MERLSALTDRLAQRHVVRQQPTHPALEQHAAQRESVAASLSEARTRYDHLVDRRRELTDPAVATLVSLGKLTTEEITARAGQLDAEIYEAGEQIKKFEAQLGQLDCDGKVLFARILAEQRAEAAATVRGIYAQVIDHFAAIEKLEAEFEAVRQRQLIAVPIVPRGLTLQYGELLRTEAATFGSDGKDRA